jgi:probable rRNA maturation factor
LSQDFTKQIIAWTKKIARAEKAAIKNLNIIITDDKYLKKLNRTYFRKNSPTNVIAFPMEEVSEIYVSYEQAKNNRELCYYIVHGLLHILGYEHTNERETNAMDNRCLLYLEAMALDR